MADIKFCGLTRPEDADAAARLGARYVGVIFAGGPRLLGARRAAEVLASLPRTVGRVGVFGATTLDALARTAGEVGLDAVQLHADPSAADVQGVRRTFGGEVWAVVRTADASLPDNLGELFAEADAVVLDAKVAGALGGTGVRLAWGAIARAVGVARRGRGRLVLAGGLAPENVAGAIAALDPDVVDVSSGVERAPGQKDHDRMRAFAEAVRATSAPPRPAPGSATAGADTTRSSIR